MINELRSVIGTEIVVTKHLSGDDNV